MMACNFCFTFCTIIASVTLFAVANTDKLYLPTLLTSPPSSSSKSYQELVLELNAANQRAQEFQQKAENLEKAESLQKKAESFEKKAENSEKKISLYKQRGLEMTKELYVLRCGKNHRYITKYFENLMHNLTFHPLPEYFDYRIQAKNETFFNDHVAKDTLNPKVKVQGIEKQYRDLTKDENQTYYKEYTARILTKKEMWKAFASWIFYSHEYQLVTNGRGVQRLNRLVETIRTHVADGTYPNNPDILVECILKNWDLLSNVVKMAPNTDFTDLFTSLHNIASQHELANYCGFLLESITKEIPFPSYEVKDIKSWADPAKVIFSTSIEGSYDSIDWSSVLVGNSTLF